MGSSREPGNVPCYKVLVLIAGDMMTTKRKGFHIVLDTTSRIVRIWAWGLWDVTVAQEFKEALHLKGQEINGSSKEWYLLMDLTACFTPPQEVRNLMLAGLTALDGQQIQKRAILAGRSIALFQVLRQTQDTHWPVYSYFRSEDEAVRWLIDETSSL
jgi:hypothetical protein